jgi:LPXTG-site transpeptidase (sortase) family protein
MTSLAADQRGVIRPQGTQCDIGAFVSQGFTLGSLTGTPQNATISTAFASPLGLTVTPVNAGDPVRGGVVTFTAPGAGASASISGSPATIGSDGTVSVTASANATVGGPYTVTASTAGATSVGFSLTNVPACSNAITVSNNNDSGAGSLRQAMADLCPGGTITFGGDTSITLTSDTLTVDKDMSIDGTGHSVTVSGGYTLIVFTVYSGEIRLNHLTITNGFANFGGGIFNNGTLTVQNSTFSGNRAALEGGGIFNYGTMTVQNSTFSGNWASGPGGGIFNFGMLALSNTIIANAPANGVCGNAGTIATNDHNLIDDGSCSPALSGDPKLGPLADNGGPTQTMALLAGSPAIDAGNDTTCLAADQRGTTRPQGAHCDIGAFELVDTTPPAVTVNQASGQADPTDASPINFTAVFSEPIQPATFTATQVSLTGTAGATTVFITESAPLDDSTFNIAVSGLTVNGKVIVSIPAGVIQDLVGNPNTASTSTDNTVTYDIIDPVVVAGPNTTPANGAVLSASISGLTVQFSKDVVHDGGTEAADAPANYLLVEDGRNGKFDTLACGPAGVGGLQPDEVQITVDSVSYDPVQFVATLNVNGGKKLPDGRYRLFVCGTTSISDFSGNKLNGGKDTSNTFTIRQPVARAPAIPSAGFAAGVVTKQPRQPAGQPYAAMGNLWMEIPKLGVQVNIEGVPQSADGGWDVSWLGNEAGWLQGSAYPTWSGNSVLTGHVFNALGQPGPFVALNTLRWGDQIIIHAGGAEYVYAVRSVKQVDPEDVTAMMQHEDSPWITLVTCRGYDEASNSYLYRLLVRAVLVEVK